MGQRPHQDHEQWLDHHHYRTYEIALGITRAVGPSGDLRDLESLALGITAFLAPWQKETAVHRFARFTADDMFLEDTQGRYIEVYEHGSGTTQTRRYLPVDIAMRSYEIGSGDVFTIPERHGREVREGNVIRWEESGQVADACYDYTLDLCRCGTERESTSAIPNGPGADDNGAPRATDPGHGRSVVRSLLLRPGAGQRSFTIRLTMPAAAEALDPILCWIMSATFC